MTQLGLLEYRSPVVSPHASPQSVQLARVEGRIAEMVIAFCEEHAGREFYASELSGLITEQLGGSPESGMRVMRALRRAGQVDVELVSRSESRYRAGRAAGASSVIAP
jgi:hypothetical protein